MKKKITILLFFIFSSLLMGQTLLQYDLKVGDTFVVQQKAEQVITQELNGAAHVITNLLDGIIEFKVTEVKENNYLISLNFQDLNMNMKSSIQGDLMNVRAKEVNDDDVQSKIFNSLLNNQVELTFDKTGNILKVIGGDSLITKMANASGIEDDFTKNMMKESLKKDFGSEALSNSYKQMTYFYSSNEIEIGDTWQNNYEGKLIAQNTWTLENLSDSEIKINGLAQVNITTNEPSISMDLKGEQTTKINASRTTGFINTMYVEGEFKGGSVMPQMGETEIPTTIKSTITYELIH